MENQNNNHDFIRELAGNSGLEQAPDRFTENVMARLTVTPSLAEDIPLLSRGTWIAIFLSVAALIVVIFTVEMPFIDRMFSTVRIQQISMSIITEDFLNSMTTFFQGLNFSGITVAIILAAAGLVVMERLLKRRFSQTNILMI
ncbi:MAG: hypothetical protein R6W71_07460 [Bacteroidales bacterium]